MIFILFSHLLQLRHYPYVQAALDFGPLGRPGVTTTLTSELFSCLCSIGVWTSATTRCYNNINESAVVLLSSLCTTSFRFLFLLWIYLRCLSLHFSSTSERTMYFSSKQSFTKENS